MADAPTPSAPPRAASMRIRIGRIRRPHPPRAARPLPDPRRSQGASRAALCSDGAIGPRTQSELLIRFDPVAFSREERPKASSFGGHLSVVVEFELAAKFHLAARRG